MKSAFGGRRLRPVWANLWDRFVASDPGLIRLLSALSTVCGIVVTLGILTALHSQVPILVAGAMTAMVSTVAITEPRPRDQAMTLAAGVLTALVTVTVGAVLVPYRVAADVLFVLLIFGAIYVRRFGPRGTSLGVFVFQLFFVTQFIEARSEQLPRLWTAVVVAFGSAALIRFGVLRSPPERTLDRLRRAFRLRLVLVLDALIEVAEGGPEAPRAYRTVDDLRRYAARLHAGALMIQGRLETGARDERTAAAIQRRVAEAETAAERLSVLLLRCLWPAGDFDTLTRHLAEVQPVPEIPGPSLEARDAVALPALISELRALRTAVGPSRRRPGEADRAALRNRLLGYLDDERLPDASPAMRDVFRSAGDFARAMFGLRLAMEGDDPAQDTPEALRSREEMKAEDIALTSGKRQDPRTGLARPSTRTAFQVSTGSALAIVGGELLSTQRWYWAVLTCWVVFISTTSTGEILVRGYRRLIGTVVGVVAGMGLAALLGDHVWAAFALVLLSVFGMYYTAPVSYTLMSFFITTMIGMLYTVLHTLSPGVLLVRIEETAVGIACGLIAALLVLPVRTRERTDQLLRTVLQQLGSALSQAVVQLNGAPADDLLDRARALDSALNGLRLSIKPLINPISPLRTRRRTALYVMGLLETCAFHTRSLAATAQLVPDGLRTGAGPGLADAARRIEGNISTLIRRMAAQEEDGAALERGAGIPSLPGAREGGERRSLPGERAWDTTVTQRVLRHLQRLDESVLGLGRALGVPVRKASKTAPDPAFDAGSSSVPSPASAGSVAEAPAGGPAATPMRPSSVPPAASSTDDG